MSFESTEESFGIIPLRKMGGVWHVFLIQHKHGRYWGFPKGHAESGETGQIAATRELKEETNLDVSHFFTHEPLTEKYQFIKEKVKVTKKVSYYVAEVSGEVILQVIEIQNGKWFTLDEALLQLTHAEGKAILQEAAKWL